MFQFDLHALGGDHARLRALGDVQRGGEHEPRARPGPRVPGGHELRGAPEPPLELLIGKLSAVDLVLVEGFKRAPHPKIEVFRQANGKPPLHPQNLSVMAIASDAPFPDAPCPVLPLDDAPGIAEAALRLAVAPSAVDWRRG